MLIVDFVKMEGTKTNKILNKEQLFFPVIKSTNFKEKVNTSNDLKISNLLKMSYKEYMNFKTKFGDVIVNKNGEDSYFDNLKSCVNCVKEMKKVIW